MHWPAIWFEDHPSIVISVHSIDVSVVLALELVNSLSNLCWNKVKLQLHLVL
jgi:hypothetical protein